jgi:hypothetical protein
MGSLILPDGAEPDPCDRLTADQLARLRGAARLLAEQRGLVPRVGGWLGGHAERVVGMLGEGWRERVQALVEEALWRAQGVATLGMAPMPLEVAGGPRAVSRGWLARAATTASGAATGFVGLPGVALDIPFTTLTILRSIADIARAEGEDIAAEEGRRACLEVLAIGGPGGADDEAQLGYWTARLGLAGLSEKVLAQAVPLAGAVAGAGLNYVFIRYYQHMARVHFTVRAIERAHDGDPAVRACLDRMVARARASGAAGTRPSRES